MSQHSAPCSSRAPSGNHAVAPNNAAQTEHVSAMRDELRQLHRLTVLGTAAATIAHEFNNLMTPIVGYAKYALDSGDVALMQKALRMTLKQTEIGTGMCDRILGLAAHDRDTPQVIKARELVDDSLACLCRDLSKDGITLRTKIDEDLAVRVNPAQLRQVLFNLLINARKAIGAKSGWITIRAERVDEKHLVLVVSDNGCGIPTEMLDTIFEPFVTRNKGNGKRNGSVGRTGLGLGLAVCRDIVQENGGTIAVESEEGVGTTFTLTLPSAG